MAPVFRWLAKGLGLPLALLAAVALIARGQEQKPTNTFFLPKNPVAAAYILGRLSNKELIEAPRSEPVYVALLQRKGLERKYRIEALDGLAKLRKTDRLAELLRGLTELDGKGEDAQSVLAELSSILLQAKPDELRTRREALEAFTVEGRQPLTRQTGHAGLMTADGSIDNAWSRAQADPNQLAELLLAIPLVRDGALRAGFYGRVRPLVERSDSPELRRAAIAALVAIPGHELETFQTLAQFVVAGTERSAAVAGLQGIPKKLWPKAQAEPLVKSLIEHLKQVPADQRTGEEFTSAIQLASDLATLLPKERATSFSKTLRGLGPVVVVIRAVYEQMLYDTQLIAVEPGKIVEIIFENPDAMPHNLVVTLPGAVEEIGQAAEKMSAEPDAQGRLYVPESPKVLHATKMVDPGQKTKLSFTAPETPGEYPYVCTFPGHWRRMTGVLAVTSDVDAYLAARAAAEPKITEWKVEDFADDLTRATGPRNTEQGKKLYTQLGCAQCHRLGKEGTAYGPDLTETLQKWKGNRADILAQIIEPSKIIDERYKTHEIVLKDGDSVFGMIVREEGDKLILQTGPAENLIQAIDKAQISERKPQTYSVMPIGLLNTLSKEQVFDLLGFIEGGGEVRGHEHKHKH